MAISACPDADREQVVGTLKTAFVQGRWPAEDELDARVDRVYASRTYAELAEVTADIPVELTAAKAPRDPWRATKIAFRIEYAIFLPGIVAFLLAPGGPHTTAAEMVALTSVACSSGFSALFMAAAARPAKGSGRELPPRAAPGAAAGAGGGERLHVSHAVAREQVSRILTAAWERGRLTEDERDARAAQVSASRCHADLAALIADLPAGLATRPPTTRDVRKGVSAIVAAAVLRGRAAVEPRQRTGVHRVSGCRSHPAPGPGHNGGPGYRRPAPEALRRPRLEPPRRRDKAAMSSAGPHRRNHHGSYQPGRLVPAAAARLGPHRVTQAPDTGGPNRHTCWLATINADGSPHVNGVGALWADGCFWFETGQGTRKGRNLARDPRCALSVATHDFDLTVEGEAALVTDPATVAGLAARWAAGGWPAGVDDTGLALTAEFSAPSACAALARLPPHPENGHGAGHRRARRRDPLAVLAARLGAFGARLGICNDLLGLLARPGTDLLGLALRVGYCLVGCLLRELQDLGRLIHVVSFAGLESRHVHLPPTVGYG